MPPTRTQKWYGAHWVLVALAELGYPPGDTSLIPLRDQILGWLFSTDYLKSLDGFTGCHACTGLH